MGIRPRSTGDRMRTIWTPEMDRYFIDLMLEQLNKGNSIDDHIFSKRAWNDMMSLFNAKFKFQHKVDVLKNRHKTLRNLYRAVKNLLDRKGFYWDGIRQMVTADNKVWDDYIKVNPDARSYRIKTIPYYSDLCSIYKNATLERKGNLPTKDANFDRNMLGSETGYLLLEGLECPATTVGEGESSDNLVESSLHSNGKTTMEVTQHRNFGGLAVEALHEIPVDEDYGVSISEEILDDDAPQPVVDTDSMMGTRARTYWQLPMDRYFIDLMLEQVKKGSHIDGQFRKQAWIEMIASFNARFAYKYEIEILKNRYKTLRRQYNVIKNLLHLDGFMWDEARQMVTADDCVWQDYIKKTLRCGKLQAHTDARQYMTRPVPYYKDLCIICGETSGDGRGLISADNSGQQDETLEAKFTGASKGFQSPAASVSREDRVGDLHDASFVDFKFSPDKPNKRQLENPSYSANSKKSHCKDEGMATALREMATAVSSLADRKKDNENSISIETLIEAIQALPDMDEDLVLDACDLLEDEKKAKTFLALDVKLRRKWLIRKLRTV